MKAPPCFEDSETKRMVKSICDENNIDVDLLKDLCEIVNEHSGSGRRFGLNEDIETVLDRFIARKIEP